MTLTSGFVIARGARAVRAPALGLAIMLGAASPGRALAGTLPPSATVAGSAAPSAPAASAAPAAPTSAPATSVSPSISASISGPSGSSYLAKKDRELADKRQREAAGPLRPVTRVGLKPVPLINLVHRWTDESLAVASTGAPPRPEQYRLLRDHYTNQAAAMADKLIPTLLAAARRFGVTRVEIVSGFRHPKYNLILRKKGHQVARDSEHTHGKAVDFRLPGVTAEQLFAWALSRRMGGCGLYLQSNFVHMDVGPIRRWSGD